MRGAEISMPKITYITTAGLERPVDVKAGQSVMEGAVKNGVAGIEAECGGACSCATCHVYVDPAWLDRIGPRTEVEQSMLDYATDVRAESRLSCQTSVTEALDGLVIRMPRRQGQA
jgi:2Fe-2S ferredoxin